jgi:transposase
MTMTRSLSGDLRGRVIGAISEGLSTREAARRFRIGISTAGTWYRRYRATGEAAARKQGQPSRSKLDPHEAFILGLIEATPDITLAAIVERERRHRLLQPVCRDRVRRHRLSAGRRLVDVSWMARGRNRRMQYLRLRDPSQDVLLSWDDGPIQERCS